MSAERAIGVDHSLHTLGQKDLQSANLKLDRLDMLTQFVDPENNLSQLSYEVEKGAYPIIYSNHTHHANIAGFRHIWRSMPVRPDTLYVIIAHSLTAGEQEDKELGRGSVAMRELFSRENVHFLETVRPKDLEQYIEDGKPEDEIRQIRRQSNKNMLTAVRSLQQDSGLFVFPAGTTAEAVKGKDGRRPGMQEVTTPLMPYILKQADKIGREVVLLPVGHAHTNRIVEPRGARPHLRTQLEIAKHKVSFGHVKPAKLAETRIGKPFTLTNMKNGGVDLNNDSAVNDATMRKVAELLPEEARGFYR